MLSCAEPGATFPAECAVRSRRGLGPSAAHGAGADHRQEDSSSTSSMATKSRRKPAWAAASTPSCRPASSPSAACCRANEAIEAIKNAIKKTYGKRGEAVVQKNFAAVDADARPSARSDSSRAASPALFDILPAVPARAPALRSQCARRDHRRPRRRSSGQRPARRRHLPHRHRTVGEAQHRARRFRCGTRSFASSAASASWFARTRSSAPRSTTPRCWRGARRIQGCNGRAGGNSKDLQVYACRSRRKTAPAARSASKSAR